MEHAVATTPEREAFYRKIDGDSMTALWTVMSDLITPEPKSPCRPHLWRFDTIRDRMMEAGKLITAKEAERRVLVLENPGLRGQSKITTSLFAGVQMVIPGDIAPAHRHSQSALRFVLEGKGAVTIVEGKPCPMLPGDLILTPGMTWHEHVNDTDERSVWVDALDVPVHGYLENRVFEPGPVRGLAPPPADEVFAAGLAPAQPSKPTSWSPMFRYPWEAAVKALEATAPDADGARRLRYANPMTGGAVLSTIDCYVLGLAKGAETTAYRTNSNAACVVVEGEGQSRVGDDTITWGPKDIFILPHGQWISHRASSDKARIFQITDRELFRRLDFLRDETRH